MPQLPERRRNSRRRAAHATGRAWVLLENVPGARADIPAKVVDFSDTGIRIELSLPLRVKRTVLVKGDVAGIVPDGKANARVVDCRPLAESGYSVGLNFESTDVKVPDRSRVLDYYEILQVSKHADPETIECVYKLQAQRYHPENRQTGDPKIFLAINEAYKILSDPLKRAAYDVEVG